MLSSRFTAMEWTIALLACASLVTCYPPHPDVIAVKHEEEQLPPQLRSPALHNPHLREVLPLTSLLHKGEMLVFDREAKNVSRKEIYNILTHAGLIPRRSPYVQGDLHQSAVPPTFEHDLFNIPLLQSQDILQYL